jgi:hypothetical protein
MAVNIPVTTGGVFLAAGSSITGSFGGMLVLAGGPSASITGLKYINGYTVVPDGKGYNNYPPAESITGSFGMANGSKLELVITSCSLAAGSSPVVLYS